MAEVPLVDLEVIVRYSLAIRQELAPAEEVLAALDESRALVLALLEGGTPNGSGEEPEEVEAPVDEAGPLDHADEDDDEVPAEVAAVEDQVALDDLAGSGADVGGPPGPDPDPGPEAPPGERRSRRAAAPAAVASPPADDTAADRRPLAEPEPEEDQAWVDEVERIRQRRMRKAQQEAEERQARQAALARQAEAAKQARRAAAARSAQEPERAAPPPQAKGLDVDDALELPPPLTADEAARRRADRRRRRADRQDPA